MEPVINRGGRERYRLLEHTADLKVAVFGSSLAELFANSAFMLFDVMLDLDAVGETESRTVVLQSADAQELLLDWLRELLFLFSAQGFVTGRAEVLEIETGRLTAVLHGETYDPARHGLKLEVKTPTYHEYRLEETAGGWQATILLDV